MKYDNERDRLKYGYDAGNIIDGKVVWDENTKEYVILDDEGTAFSSQSLLKSLHGKKVRLTCISFESIENIQKMLLSASDASNGESN